MKQGQALAVMLAGNSVFLTGAPGSGKTYTLNAFVKKAANKGKRVAVTASTGIAATHIGGMTIHSWSGLGIRDQLDKRDLEWLTANARLNKRYNGTDILVVDEVSMLHGKRLDMVNEACKLLRKSEQPFGGLQVILVGDLFQLPPVNREAETLDFAHMSQAWAELSPKICYLREQHRQAGDELLDLLEAMRRNDLTDWHTEILQSRLGKRPDATLPVTRLYAHNVDVETINDRHLSALTSDSKTFTMQTKGAAAKVDQLSRSVLAPPVLELKVGAEVMFVANNFPLGFVNGSRGTVLEFRDGLPLVKLTRGGRKIKVEPHSWTLQEDGRVRAEVIQLPLRLAWAITIHKSQGMSLDAAEMDLSKTFTPGMGYVALSRVRDLSGVYLAGINRMALELHPDIYSFDAELGRLSSQLAAITDELAEEEEAEPESDIAADKELLSKLKIWRLERSRKDRVPPFIIAHDKLLEQIAIHKPVNAQQLLGLPGFGRRKIETYGENILGLLKEFGVEAESSEDSQLDKTAIDEKTGQISGYEKLRMETIAQYSKAFSRWQPDEDIQLMRLVKSGAPLTEVCQTLQRQPAAVWARLLQNITANDE